MPTVITDSPDITSLDSKITSDLCGGNFIIDVTPSVFIGTRYNNVQGASVKITNPVGVVIRNFITSGFDITPPMTGDVEIVIPLVAGNYSYGTYIIEVKMTDSEDTEYSIIKNVNICPPDKKNKSKKEGCLSASIKGNCTDGKVVILLDGAPTYKGFLVTSQSNELTLEYPTGSELPVLETTLASFSTNLFEGIYKLTGSVCALYTADDNLFYQLPYKVKCEKKIICTIDECCIQGKIDELNDKLKSDCSDEEKSVTSSIILQTLFLLHAAKGSASCGLDPSDYISDLEDLLGCSCSCNCNEGAPIINNAPVTDFTFEGCKIEQSTVGLTKNIKFTAKDFILTTPENSGIMLSAPVVDENNCLVSQEITLEERHFNNLPYKVIYGLLTQTGTGIPTFIELANTTGAALSFSRGGVGNYLMISDLPIFVSNKVGIFVQPMDVDGYGYLSKSNTTNILIRSKALGVFADGVLDSLTIEIRINL